MSQKEYAEKVLKIGFDALAGVESETGNPTLKTLRSIAKPFGLDVGFVRKK